mgnify:CR=1 FL=1
MQEPQSRFFSSCLIMYHAAGWGAECPKSLRTTRLGCSWDANELVAGIAARVVRPSDTPRL